LRLPSAGAILDQDFANPEHAGSRPSCVSVNYLADEFETYLPAPEHHGDDLGDGPFAEAILVGQSK
jgi:hypothetical protein